MSAVAPSARGLIPVQGTFDELGRPLREVTFVVVDLETTGGSANSCDITEIGAVKVRGGEVIGEFQTLVNPSTSIPPFIAVLTGITDAMVAGAPRIDTVLPAFLEFSKGAVLVAHNAPFDLGFLRAGCDRLGLDWPSYEHLDTARLARRVLHRDEAPNCKLSTLAHLFRATTTPNHRALSDARATVDVLHGLIARLGNLGVHSLEELSTFSAQVSPAQRRKRHLADAMPTAPGVYLFRDGQGRVLYVGKSRNLRTRVRTYFTASEMRTRMAEMVGIAERVDPVVCATPLEAEVRELRLIAEHRPRYNRRSKFPERAVWLKLTVEPFPRLSQVRKVLGDGATYVGPFGSARTAELAMAAVHEALPLRQCTKRLSARLLSPACVLAEMRRCGAPCQGGESVDDYAVHADAFRAAVAGDPSRIVEALTARIHALAGEQRFEDAASHRDRLSAFIRTVARLQRLSALTSVPQLVAAQPTADLGWGVSVIRYGRLVAAGVVPRGAHPAPYVDALIATAETVTPGVGPLPAATAEEVHLVLRWLEQPGTRMVAIEGTWASPAFGAGAQRAWLEFEPRESARPFDDRRGLRPVARPARATA
ncbi:MAG: polymerase subunit epsilon [Actinomycetota bacterium]|nr:polymerase subunit epsilon [Actinomycetota bacterium]